MAPPLTRISPISSPDNGVTIAGEQFDSSTSFWSYGQTNSSNGTLLQSASANNLLMYRDSSSDGHFCSIQLPPLHTANSMYPVWSYDGASYSKPLVVNRTTARFILGSDTAGASCLQVRTWSSGITFAANERAISGGITYESVKNSNSNHAPPNTTWWRVVNYVYQAWNSTYIYNKYMRVTVSGVNYESIQRYGAPHATQTVTSNGASPNSQLTMASANNILAGDYVNGAGLPLDCTVVSVDSPTQVTVNAVVGAAGVTYSNVSFTLANINQPPASSPTWWRAISDGNRDIVSVLGINLTHQGDTQAQLHSGVWAVSPGVVGQWITPTAVSPYRVDFQMPADSAQGLWNIYLHNGHGGIYGYSGPLALNVTTAAALGINYDNSTVALAASGGDDSTAIETACATIQATGQPGTITLNTSVYHVSRLTHLATNGALVKLRGTGKRGSGSESEIRILSGSSVSTMFDGGTGTAFDSLTLNATIDTPSTASSGVIAIYNSGAGFNSAINCTFDSGPPNGTTLIEAITAQLFGQNTRLRLCDLIGLGINYGGGTGFVVDSNTFTLCGSAGNGFASKDAAFDCGFSSAMCFSDNVVKDRVLAAPNAFDKGHARMFGLNTAGFCQRNLYIGCNRTISLRPDIVSGATGEGEQVIGEGQGSLGMVPVLSASNSPPSVSIARAAMFTTRSGTLLAATNATTNSPTVSTTERPFTSRDIGFLVSVQIGSPAGWLAHDQGALTSSYITSVTPDPVNGPNAILGFSPIGSPGNPTLSGGLWYTDNSFQRAFGSDLSSSDANLSDGVNHPTVTSASVLGDPNSGPLVGDKIWIPDNGSGPDNFISNGPSGRVYSIIRVISNTSVVLDRACGGGGGNCNSGAWSVFADYAGTSLRPTITAGKGKLQENVCNGITGDSTKLTLLLEQPWAYLPDTTSMVVLWWSTSEMVVFNNILSGQGSAEYGENGTPSMCSVPSGMTNCIFDGNVVSGLWQSGKEWSIVGSGGVDSNNNIFTRSLCPNLWNLIQNNVHANLHGTTVLGQGSLPLAFGAAGVPTSVTLMSHGGILRNERYTLVTQGNSFSQSTGLNNYLLEHIALANAPFGVYLSDSPSQATDSSYQFYKNSFVAGSANPNLEGIKYDLGQTYVTNPPKPTVFSQFSGYTNNDGTS